MALSGSVATNTHDGRYYTLSWSATQSIANNQSVISWTLSCAGGVSWYAERTLTVVIAGQTVANKSNRVERYAGVISSGSFTVDHAWDGTYNFSVSIKVALEVSTINTTGSGSFSLNQIVRMASITDYPTEFTDVDSPTIYFDNPVGSNATIEACISLTQAVDDVPYRPIEKATDTSYTFKLSEEELNTLYNATLSTDTKQGSNSITVHFFVRTKIGGNTHWSAKPTTFIVTNPEPSLEPTVEDQGDVSYSATGNRNILLRYFNYPKATFNSEAKKGATIVSRTVTCGNDTKTADDGDWVQFNNVSDNVFIFTVRDNRGNEVSKTVTKEMINYVTPTCRSVITTDLSNDNTANINIDITGKYYQGSLGKINNALTVEYRYKTLNGTFGAWTQTSTPTVTGEDYAVRVTIPSLDYKGTYVIQTRAKDAIYTDGTLAKEEYVKFVPVFDWGEDDFNFNVPVAIEGKPVYPSGYTGRIAKAYTQETDITYESNSYIKLLREGSSTDLYNQDIATFNDNGLITINKDMLALVNIHIVSNNPTNNRSWIILWNYNTDWKQAECIQYGTFTTSQITTVLKLNAGDVFGIRTVEKININSSGLTGSYIEIIEL